jgi:hypothetical protein
LIHANNCKLSEPNLKSRHVIESVYKPVSSIVPVLFLDGWWVALIGKAVVVVGTQIAAAANRSVQLDAPRAMISTRKRMPMPDDPDLITDIIGPISEGPIPLGGPRSTIPLRIDVQTASGQKVLVILPSAAQQLAAEIARYLQARGSP